MGEHLQGPTTKSVIRIDGGPVDATSSVYKARDVLRLGLVVLLGTLFQETAETSGRRCERLVPWSLCSIEDESCRFATSQSQRGIRLGERVGKYVTIASLCRRGRLTMQNSPRDIETSGYDGCRLDTYAR